ncbi:MAG: hypothetical protein WCJ54_05535 [Actinomycetota bacterium]|jgi:hypothetical protein
MFFIVEIILISLIAAAAVIYTILYLKKELKGDCSCGNICNSCRIKETCNEPKPPVKSGKKANCPGKQIYNK